MIAETLKQKALSSIDTQRVSLIIEKLMLKFEESAAIGNLERVLSLYENSHKIFSVNQYNMNDAETKTILTILKNKGFEIEFRHGVEGLYAVAKWD